MEILIKVLQFFLCFTILVGIHEMGHFFMARIFKIRVEKFYIFLDPWFSLFKFKRKGTEYGIGWLPLGGYVKIAGMIDESLDKDQMKQPAKPDEFRSKPAWQRFLVLIAGVVMNIVLAMVIYTGICYAWGESYFSNKDAIYGYTFNETGKDLGFMDGDRFISIDGKEVDNINGLMNDLLITEGDRHVVVERDGEQVELILPLNRLIEMRKNKLYENLFTLMTPFIIDSAASDSAIAAGLQRGDMIIAFNEQPATDFQEYKELLTANKGKEALFTVVRGLDTLDVTMPINVQGEIGVMVKAPEYKLRTKEYTFWQAIPAGIKKTGHVMANYWDQLKMIVQPKTKMYQELGGLVTIGNIFPSQWNWEDFWFKTGFLSIILAIMNILPIPGLDGGHAIFTMWEIVTRRRPSDKFLERAQYVGLLIIITLLLYANGNDIYRFFIK